MKRLTLNSLLEVQATLRDQTVSGSLSLFLSDKADLQNTK